VVGSRTTLGLFSRASNGSGAEQSLTQSANFQAATDWSRDGRFLLFNGGDPGHEELWVLPLTQDGRAASSGQAKRYRGPQFDTRDGRFSPDSRWVAYESEESGKDEIYIDAFPEPHGKVQVSTKGGTRPAWGPSGRELYTPSSRIGSGNNSRGADGSSSVSDLRPQKTAGSAINQAVFVITTVSPAPGSRSSRLGL
jgi:Tol biopolymer transport system component